jgi:hypothetical protein
MQVLGQIVSGLARLYNATGDPAAQAKVQRLVKGFAATIDIPSIAGIESVGCMFPCLRNGSPPSWE